MAAEKKSVSSNSILDAIAQENFFEISPPVMGDNDSSSDQSDTEEKLEDGSNNSGNGLSNRVQHFATSVTKKAGRVHRAVRSICSQGWNNCHFNTLPKWLQDNEYLRRNHRPPLPSFAACFMSMFRLHTETINIWTHLLGCALYVALAFYFLCQPEDIVPLEVKMVFAIFFVCIIFCLGMSCLFHTVCCHSPDIDRLFSKLDYCGIVILAMGSSISWVYFYHGFKYFVSYIALMVSLGSAVITVILSDFVSGPDNRLYRTIIFSGFGVSAAIPALHYMLSEGFLRAFYHDSVGWLCLSGIAYVLSAIIYALRIPERFFPGKCDVWFQSHQIMHLLVVAAAFFHYCAVYNMAFCANYQIKEPL